MYEVCRRSKAKEQKQAPTTGTLIIKLEATQVYLSRWYQRIAEKPTLFTPYLCISVTLCYYITYVNCVL